MCQSIYFKSGKLRNNLIYKSTHVNRKVCQAKQISKALFSIWKWKIDQNYIAFYLNHDHHYRDTKISNQDIVFWRKICTLFVLIFVSYFRLYILHQTRSKNKLNYLVLVIYQIETAFLNWRLWKLLVRVNNSFSTRLFRENDTYTAPVKFGNMAM